MLLQALMRGSGWRIGQTPIFRLRCGEEKSALRSECLAFGPKYPHFQAKMPIFWRETRLSGGHFSHSGEERAFFAHIAGFLWNCVSLRNDVGILQFFRPVSRCGDGLICTVLKVNILRQLGTRPMVSTIRQGTKGMSRIEAGKARVLAVKAAGSPMPFQVRPAVWFWAPCSLQ